MTDNSKPGLVMPESGKTIRFKSFRVEDNEVLALDETGQLWLGVPEHDEGEEELLHMIWKKLNMPTGKE